MAGSGSPGRVLLLVKVHAPGASAVLMQPPPDSSIASAHWMRKLAGMLKPLGQADGSHSFGCCLLGNLAEVSDHLWQHQTLWMCFRAQDQGAKSAAAAERHVAVQLSELLEGAPDLSSGRYANVVELEEEDSLGGSGTGQVSVGIELLAVGPGQEGLPPSAAQLLHEDASGGAFVLALELTPGSASVLAGLDAHRFRLRIGGVEQELCSPAGEEEGEGAARVQHTLVLVDSWEEVPLALSGLEVCVQAPSAALQSGADAIQDFEELPVDLSALIAAVAAPSGGGAVVAEVASCEVPGLGSAGLTFSTSVAAVRWSEQLGGQLMPGRSRDSDVWASGLRLMAAGQRHWRVSVELRSVRLMGRTANIFVTYAYEPFLQPRPFRTNPPTLVRRKATVYLPHSFAAYTLTASLDELK
ncbi:unnamed protein product, partial [Polarella glacialis]